MRDEKLRERRFEVYCQAKPNWDWRWSNNVRHPPIYSRHIDDYDYEMPLKISL